MHKSRFLILISILLIFAGCEKDSITEPPTDTTQPKLFIANPVNNSTVLGMVEIVATVIDFDSIVQVEFYIDDNLPDNGIDSTETYSYLWDTSTLEKGSSHTIFAKAYDVNNDSIISSIVNVTIITGTILVPSEYTTIQSGIDAAGHVDTVLVSPGTYIENIDFNGKNIVLGSLFLTTGDTSYISRTVIDGNANGRVVMFQNGEDSTAVLTGFTVTNGSSEFGGGILCFNNSNPSLSYLNVTGNTATYGAGIYCEVNANPFIDNVTINANIATGKGGGMFIIWESNPILVNVTISSNTAGTGGGIYCERYADPHLEDVTIEGNTANADGGGIVCWLNSNPYLFNVTISENFAGNRGGGIYCYGTSSPTLSSVTIIGNTAEYSGGGIHLFANSNLIMDNVSILDNSGGGIFCDLSSPLISNTTISGNSVWGGILIQSYSAPELTNVLITDNTSESWGGGIYIMANSNPIFDGVIVEGNSAEYGGGLAFDNYSGNPIFRNFLIKNNSASYGGGIYLYGPTYLFNIKIIDNSALIDGGGIYKHIPKMRIDNAVISGNTAGNNGGGIFISDGSGITDSLLNVTISQNTATNEGGGIYYNARAPLSVINTTLWDDLPNEIYYNSPYSWIDSLRVSYSDVKGGEVGIETSDDAIIIWGDGNIDSDPMFVDSDNGDFHLQSGSPCIDSGNPDPQFYDTDGSRNDIGAYGGPNGDW